MERIMKTKSLYITLVLLLSVTVAHAQDSTSRMFDKFEKNKEVTTVFISKAVLGLIPSATASVEGVDIGELKDKLEQLEIYTSKNADACKTFRIEMEAVQKEKNVEMLMSIKDKGDTIKFYARKDGGKIKELLMFVNEPDECVIIRLLGSFTSDDVKKITKK